MRIDFEQAFKKNDFADAKEKIQNLKYEHWNKFGEMIKKEKVLQIILF